MQRLIDLLVGISEDGSLAKACARAQLSYRYAWGILRSGQKILGAPLVESTRGSGAKLTALGEKLVWANKRIAARLSPLLDTLASEIEVEFERAVAHAESILRIHASHGFAVETLHRFLTRNQIAADVKYRSSLEVVSALMHDSCDLAGMHVPLGELAPKFLRRYAKVLRSDAYRLVDLVTRNQGLMVAEGNPKRIAGCARSRAARRALRESAKRFRNAAICSICCWRNTKSTTARSRVTTPANSRTPRWPRMSRAAWPMSDSAWRRPRANSDWISFRW